MVKRMKIKDRRTRKIIQHWRDPVFREAVRKTRDGGMYTEAESKLRYDAIKKSMGKCEACGASPKSGAVLNVDHIKSIRNAPHLIRDPGNLQVLCSDCNWGKGNRDSTDWRCAS
jgi:5-methylcytosine-specific restriction endonuclease McrA